MRRPQINCDVRSDLIRLLTHNWFESKPTTNQLTRVPFELRHIDVSIEDSSSYCCCILGNWLPAELVLQIRLRGDLSGLTSYVTHPFKAARMEEVSDPFPH